MGRLAEADEIAVGVALKQPGQGSAQSATSDIMIKPVFRWAALRFWASRPDPWPGCRPVGRSNRRISWLPRVVCQVFHVFKPVFFNIGRRLSAPSAEIVASAPIAPYRRHLRP
jgi:hypothetical protein